MKIKKITVKKLFGTRDFELNLKNGHGFFFGENGAGKTTFLNIIYSMLSGQKNLIPKDLKYNYFVIEFEDGNKLESRQIFQWPVLETTFVNPTTQIDIMNNQMNNQINNLNNNLTQYKSYLESIKVNYPYLNNFSLEKLIEYIINKDVNLLIRNSELSNLFTSISNTISRDLGNINPLNFYNNILSIYESINQMKEQNSFEESRQLLDNINNDILFLNVYRNRPKVFLNKTHTNSEKDLYEEGDIILTSQKLDELKQKVQNSAFQIKNLIQNSYIQMSNNLLDKLLSYDENGYEFELLDENDKNTIDMVFAYIHGIDLEKKERLKKILFEGEKNLTNKILIDSFKSFLDEYKVNSLPIEDEINRFLTIVNKYLVHKNIYFDKKTFTFLLNIGSDSRELDEKLLSSGEKHIFSVFSNLVFNKKEKIHLLIDEPELSLSINWQKMFIEDITSFDKVKNLIFVTHSPYVIPEDMLDDLQKFPSGN
jgi:predicted ATPase